MKFSFSLLAFVLFFALSSPVGADLFQVSGIVFLDNNRNLLMDQGEMPLAGVSVSNQRQVVQTDFEGRYSLPLDDNAIIFVTVPSYLRAPLDENNLPRFYYIHQPDGGPSFRFPTIAPTGPLPPSVDFPLFPGEHREDFTALIFGDPQPNTREHLRFLRDDIVAPLIGDDADFSIALGDILFDNLSLFPEYIQSMGRLGIPVYNVAGNHDINYDAETDRDSLETFKKHLGPPFYSFDYGNVHFVILDDVYHYVEKRDGKRIPRYKGKIGKDQLEWLANDLRYVPKNKLLVISMHIPLFTTTNGTNRENILDFGETVEIVRAFENVLFLTGHAHTNEHHFLAENTGRNRHKPIHQIICGAVCGGWWSGPVDDRGIPASPQGDGVPNGYYRIEFKDNQYVERFIPACLDPDFQLRIETPAGSIPYDELTTGLVTINVFDGTSYSTVECLLNGTAPVNLTHSRLKSPWFESLMKNHKDTFRSWLHAVDSNHIWQGPLPSNIAPGFHTLTAATVDRHGRRWNSSIVFEVTR